MLRYTLLFFAIAVVAAIFGFGGIATQAVGIAQVLFYLAVVVFVVTVVMGLVERRA